MSELNREQIIKALECCKSPKLTKCYGCPRDKEDGHCMYRLNEDALSLIKELTEENERLSGAVKQYEEERKYHFEMSRKRIVEAKADTVRKMQDRLMECFNNEVEHLAMYTEAQVIFAIDQIAKEMLEGDNEN